MFTWKYLSWYPIFDYIDQFSGAQVTGQDSGVSAVVDSYILEQDSEGDK